MADAATAIALGIIASKPAVMVTQAMIDLSESFLATICKPAGKEFGLLLKDRVHAWRTANTVKTTLKGKDKMGANAIPEGHHAHPRVVHQIIEQSSWVEDEVVQDLWAGLLSSSCTESGDDDSNLIFTNILGNLTKLQAKALKYACEKAGKTVTPTNKLLQPHPFTVPLNVLAEHLAETDIQRIDRELDNLLALGLINGGIHSMRTNLVDLTPTPLALHMYVRCQGSRVSPVDYFCPDLVKEMYPEEHTAS